MKKNTVVIVAIVVLVIGLLAGVAIGRASAIKHTFKDDATSVVMLHDAMRKAIYSAAKYNKFAEQFDLEKIPVDERGYPLRPTLDEKF